MTGTIVIQDIERLGAGSDGDHSGSTVSYGFAYGELLSDALGNVCDIIEKHIIRRKEILFLPIGYKEWKGFEEKHRNWLNADIDIYVVPLPLLTKDPLGQAEVSEEKLREGLQIERYPVDIVYSDWQTYDVSQHCPDIIYIQNPYDTENPYLTVPPQYYASVLRNYTDKLVFIPFKDTGEFGEKDGPDLYNLKHYAAAPGVLYADEVIVQSENIKNHYVNALMNLFKESLYLYYKGKNGSSVMGREHAQLLENIWIDKIRVRDNKTEKNFGEEADQVQWIEETIDVVNSNQKKCNILYRSK